MNTKHGHLERRPFSSGEREPSPVGRLKKQGLNQRIKQLPPVRASGQRLAQQIHYPGFQCGAMNPTMVIGA